MSQFSNQVSNNNNSNIFFILLVLLLLVATTAFSQTATENSTVSSVEFKNTDIIKSVAKQDQASSGSTMNFVIWFMGSKQDPNIKISTSTDSTKKQFMTSGTAPNRLLIKAFLKKAINFETATA